MYCDRLNTSAIERHSHCTISDLHLRTRRGRSIIWDHCGQNCLKHSWRRSVGDRNIRIANKLWCRARSGVQDLLSSRLKWCFPMQLRWSPSGSLLVQVLRLFSWILSQIFHVRNGHKSKWRVMIGRGGGKRACACESLNESWEEWVPLHTSELTRRCLRLAHVCRK